MLSNYNQTRYQTYSFELMVLNILCLRWEEILHKPKWEYTDH